MNDLAIIKKKYGEKMSQLCRDLFPTLLENEGLLSNLLLECFNESHYLYHDLVNEHLEREFRGFIYSMVELEESRMFDIFETPFELMEKAGYVLFECKSEDDIQKFKKYYAKDEELCTFKENRLNKCHVFFAVKKDVDEIKRDNFSNPKRQDLYGTSVISIQFTKDSSHTLSIKNRYNHRVNNPDATFSNNLDNIIFGLTRSFEVHFGMFQKNNVSNFEIPDYVRANDGKFYKYSYEINNIYYCPNNIIIDNFEVKRFDKSRYLLIDYFIIDFVNKKILSYDEKIIDCFVDLFVNISRIDIKNVNDGKCIDILFDNDKKCNIGIDMFNRITKLSCYNIKTIGVDFLAFNKVMSSFNFPNFEVVGDNFLYFNDGLKKLELPKLVSVEDNFLFSNEVLNEIIVCNLISVGNNFLSFNIGLDELVTPSLEVIGDGFLEHAINVKKFSADNLRRIGADFMSYNRYLSSLVLPRLEIVGDSFLLYNHDINMIEFKDLKEVGNMFLFSNIKLTEIYLPKLVKIGSHVLCYNKELKKYNFDSLEEFGFSFLDSHYRKEFIKREIKEKIKVRRLKQGGYYGR